MKQLHFKPKWLLFLTVLLIFVAAQSSISQTISSSADNINPLIPITPSEPIKTASEPVPEIERYSISVFPNPTSGNVFIKNNSSLPVTETVEIFNLLGQLISHQLVSLPPATQQEIALVTKTKGICLLKISNGNTENIFKITIE